MRNWGLLLALTLVIAPDMAAAQGAGVTAFGFARIVPGARQAAMGGAFTAIGGDISAMTANPAGLARLSSSEAAMTYANYFLDVQYGLIAYARPVGANQTLAAGIQYVSYGAFRRTDQADPTGAQSGVFGAGDVAVIVSYSRKLGPYLAVGASAKMLVEHIDYATMDGYAADLGVQVYIPVYRFSGGVALQNAGVVRHGLTPGRRDPLPTGVRVGIGHTPEHLSALLTAELEKGRGQKVAARMGIEFNIRERAFLRVGYATSSAGLRVERSDSRLTGVTGGIGVAVKSGRLDYALTPAPRIGVIHRITLIYRFG